MKNESKLHDKYHFINRTFNRNSTTVPEAVLPKLNWRKNITSNGTIERSNLSEAIAARLTLNKFEHSESGPMILDSTFKSHRDSTLIDHQVSIDFQ